MTPQGAMDGPALALHAGRVSHVRHISPRVGFNYRVWMISIDLDRASGVRSRLFRFNRAGLVSLYERDHGPRDGTSLRRWVEERLAGAGLAEYGANIRFMAIPRLFGYAFNPIAFFFCRDSAGRLGAVLHQVKNTFGDQTSYLLPVATPGAGTTHGQCAKRMHVSPFFDMAGGYRFAVKVPEFDDPTGRLAIAIRYGAEGAPRLTAVMRLLAQEFSDAGLIRLLLAMPLLPFTVVAAIHWQALKLWLRGAKYHTAPAPSPAGDLGGLA
jgi:DUF1365 family protein